MKTIFQIPKLSTIRLNGTDRVALLQNLCTQDLRGLETGQGRELFITDVKGRAIGHGLVCVFESSLLLLLTNADPSKMMAHLDRYIIREDVQLTDETEGRVWYAAQDNPLESWTPNLSEKAYSCAEVQLQEKELTSCQVYRWPIVAPGGIVIGLPESSQTLIQKIWQGKGFELGSNMDFTLARITSNWPWYGVDFNEQNLPQEVDRNEQAISFTKGCYLGQETIARLDALGQIQKKLCRIRIDDARPIDSNKVENQEGKDIGWITSSAIDASNGKTIAFCFLRRGYFEIGTVLQSGGRRCEVM